MKLLSEPQLVKYDEGIRYPHDMRQRVDCIVYEYAGNDGERYRVPYYTKPGVPPTVINSGEHRDIRRRAVQVPV